MGSNYFFLIFFIYCYVNFINKKICSWKFDPMPTMIHAWGVRSTVWMQPAQNCGQPRNPMFSSSRVVHTSRSELLSETNELVCVCFTKWLLWNSHLPQKLQNIWTYWEGFFFPPLWKGLSSIVPKCLTKKEQKKERLRYTSQLHGVQGAEPYSLSLQPLSLHRYHSTTYY